MRQNLFGGEIADTKLRKGISFDTVVETLTADFTIPDGYPQMLFLDPGGAGRDVLLPPESKGDFAIIVNTADNAENITVKEDSDTTTIGVVGQNEVGMFFCDGTTWHHFTGVA